MSSESMPLLAEPKPVPQPIYMVAHPDRLTESHADRRRIFAAKMMLAYFTSLVFGWLACVTTYMARDELKSDSADLTNVTYVAFSFTAFSWLTDLLFRGDYPGIEMTRDNKKIWWRGGECCCFPISVRIVLLLTEISLYVTVASIAVVFNLMLLLLFTLITLFANFVRVLYGVMALAHNKRGHWFDYPVFMGQC